MELSPEFAGELGLPNSWISWLLSILTQGSKQRGCVHDAIKMHVSIPRFIRSAALQ